MQHRITETVRLRLETHEFHNYCIMMQDSTYTCAPVHPPARLPVVRPSVRLTRLFDSYLFARAGALAATGGGVERLG